MSLDAAALAALPEGSVVQTDGGPWFVKSRREYDGVAPWYRVGGSISRYSDDDVLGLGSITLVSLPVATLREAAGGDPDRLAEYLAEMAHDFAVSASMLDDPSARSESLLDTERLRSAVAVLRLISKEENAD